MQNVIDGSVLVFTETKRATNILYNRLLSNKYSVTCIHGDKTQLQREEALDDFKSRKKVILIATDLASRGLDISHVNLVINYDMPSNIDDYVHRIGRTGRAGNKGTSKSFINMKNKNITKELYDLL